MSVFATYIYVDAYLNGAWTIISPDVIGKISYFYGIKGSSPIDRIASPGWMSFTLNNSDSNSAGLEGYYTPGHANVRDDFGTGMQIRLRIIYGGVTRYKWYGTIPADGISIVQSPHGVAKTQVRAVDYMDIAARHEMISPAFTTDKTIQQIVPLILANMVIQPKSTSYGLGSETFEAVFDTVTEKTRALTEFAKVVLSEFGYLYTERAAGSGLVNMEVLRAEGRSTRILYVIEPTLITTESGNVPALFDNSHISLNAPYGSQLYNRISISTHSRRIDDVSTKVLFSTPSTHPIEIPAYGTFQFVAKYTDIHELADEVTGSSMQTMASGTDWIANTNITFTGTNKTSVVTASTPDGFGTHDALVSIKNDDPGAVFVYIQLRGKGSYIYKETTTVFEDDTSIAAVGPRPLNIDMRYGTIPAAIRGLGEQLLAIHKDAFIMPESVGFIANRNDKLMAAWMYLEPGDRIRLIANAQAIDADYFIQGCYAEISPKGLVKYGYYLTDAVDEMDYIFYAELGAAFINGYNATYATARSTSYAFDNTQNHVAFGQTTGYYVYRTFLKWDTSSLPDGVRIKSVKLIMTADNQWVAGETAFNIQVLKQDWSAYDPIAAGNREAAYDACLAIGTGATVCKTWAISSDLLEDIPYEGAELPVDWINKTGITYLSIRSNRDKSNTTPTNNESISVYKSIDSNPITLWPRLVITVAGDNDTPDVFIIAGQSNASGRGVNNQVYTATAPLKAYMLGNDYVYKELIDPTDDHLNQIDTVSEDTGAWKGSVWPLLATSIMASTGRRVVFVPCAKGSTEINEWLPGADHQDRTTLYGSMVYRALQAANYGTLRGVLWYEGEANVALETPRATFNARVDTISDAIMADLAIPSLWSQIHLIAGEDTTLVNGAITDAIADNANVKAGADMHLFAPSGDLHYNSDADLIALEAGWWTALQAAFGWT